MKKIYFFLLLVIACNLSMSAQGRFTVGKLTYEPVTVDGVDGWKIVEPAEVITGELVIPRDVTFNGVTKPVLVIGQEAFLIASKDNNEDVRLRADRAKGITTLTFEAGSQLKIIQDYAFYDADGTGSLNGTVTIPATVDSLGEAILYPNEKLDVIRFEYGSKIQKFDLSSYYTKKLYLPKSISGQYYPDASLMWNADNVYVEWDATNIPFLWYGQIVREDVTNHPHMTVPIGTKTAYMNTLWRSKYYFEFTEITLDEHKAVQKAYVDDYVRRALWGETPSAEVAAIISAVRTKIENATTAQAASDAIKDLEVDMLIQCKREKTEHIKTLLAGVENKYLNSIAAEALKYIPILNDYNEINHYYECVPKLEAAMTMYHLAEAPTTSGAGMRMKITKNDDTVWEFKLTDKMELGSEVHGTASASDVNAFALTFVGEGTPAEKEHYLDGKGITFSNGGEQMTLSANGSTATYPINNVSEMTLFHGTPSVKLNAIEGTTAGTYYTTFYSGLEEYIIPEGVKAYMAEIAGDAVIFSPLADEVLPQGEPVLLYSEESGEMTLEVASLGYAKSDANLLHGVDVQSVPEPAYQYFTLSCQNGEFGFYKMSDMTLTANSAFLTLPADVQAEAFRIIFSDMEGDICQDGHRYIVEKDRDGNAVWIWDGVTKAMLQLVCSRNLSHRSEVVASDEAITNAITTEQTCTTGGVRTYTAVLTYNGVEYKGTTTETLAALGHDYLHGICQTCGDSPSHFHEFVLTDGIPYLITHDCTVDELTYTRNFSSRVVDKWQPLFVPFGMELTADVLDKCDIAMPFMVATQGSSAPGISEASGYNVVVLMKLNLGDVAQHGTAYFIRPKQEGEMTIAFENAVLYDSQDVTTLTCATTLDNYAFSGIYSSGKPSSGTWYAINADGELQLGNNDSYNLPAQRWYMTKASKTDNNPAQAPMRAMRIVTLGEDDEASAIISAHADNNAIHAIYSPTGIRLNTPQKGINIINGKKFIVK